LETAAVGSVREAATPLDAVDARTGGVGEGALSRPRGKAQGTPPEAADVLPRSPAERSASAAALLEAAVASGARRAVTSAFIGELCLVHASAASEATRRATAAQLDGSAAIAVGGSTAFGGDEVEEMHSVAVAAISEGARALHIGGLAVQSDGVPPSPSAKGMRREYRLQCESGALSLLEAAADVGESRALMHVLRAAWAGGLLGRVAHGLGSSGVDPCGTRGRDQVWARLDAATTAEGMDAVGSDPVLMDVRGLSPEAAALVVRVLIDALGQAVESQHRQPPSSISVATGPGQDQSVVAALRSGAFGLDADAPTRVLGAMSRFPLPGRIFVGKEVLQEWAADFGASEGDQKPREVGEGELDLAHLDDGFIESSHNSMDSPPSAREQSLESRFAAWRRQFLSRGPSVRQAVGRHVARASRSAAKEKRQANRGDSLGAVGRSKWS